MHAVQRLILRSSRTPLRRVWAVLYGAVGRLAGLLLVRGVPGASVYVRQGAAGADLLPGMSDIDLAIVTPGDAARVRRRWGAVHARVPGIDRVLDRPLIFEQDELARIVAGGSALTYGLGDGEPAYFGERPNVDWTRTLEHPGIDGPVAGWRLLRGTERRPPPVVRDEQDDRLAAWLQLVLWWRWTFLFCDEPEAPRAADVCVKALAEAARAWLLLAHGERPAGRLEALRRLPERLPEEEAAARLALDLRARLAQAPAAPFAAVLPALVRMTQRVEALIAEQLAGVDRDAVRIAGAPKGAAVPLADWPGVAAPRAFDESFTLAPGSAANPAALVAALRGAGDDSYRALRDGNVLVLPARPLPRSRLRAIKTPITDPVSFALLEGAAVARFPQARGWSASDLARRAVAEHRAWLRTRRVPPRPWMPPPPPSQPLALLLTAARAKLFADSLTSATPELIVDAVELGRRLGPQGEEAVAAYAAGGAPPGAVVAALEPVVAGLYA